MSEVNDLKEQLSNLKLLISKKETALKLSSNKEFKSLILNDFCIQECARYAQSSADPALTVEQRADALALAQAAGHLRRFLSVVIAMGTSAEHQLYDMENAISEAEVEEEENSNGY